MSVLGRQVERVRDDGNWIVGDPSDTDIRPWKIDGRVVNGVPRLLLYHRCDGGPVPVIPGWKTPCTGFMLNWGEEDRVMFMEYIPVSPTDPNAPPEQLALFDLV